MQAVQATLTDEYGAWSHPSTISLAFSIRVISWPPNQRGVGGRSTSAHHRPHDAILGADPGGIIFAIQECAPVPTAVDSITWLAHSTHTLSGSINGLAILKRP